MEEWPLQVYVSAVIWSPEPSLVRKRNLDRVPWLRSVAPSKATWAPRVVRFSRGIVDRQVQAKISSDGEFLAAVCQRFDFKLSSSIYVWDIAKDVMQGEIFGPSTEAIREMGFSQDNKKIIWISETNSVYSWEMSRGRTHNTPVEHPGFGEIVVLSSDGMQVASIVSGHGIFIWDTSTGKLRVNILLNDPDYENRLFFSLNDTQIMCNVSDQEVCIWDTMTGKLKKRLAKPPGFSHCLSQSPDGIDIGYSSPEAEVFFWNSQSGHIRKLERCTCSEERLVISPDAKSVTYKKKNVIDVWDVTTGRVRNTWRMGDLLYPMKMAFSPTGNSLVFLTYDSEVKVLDLASESLEEIGQPPKILAMYKNTPIHTAFSHDGEKVVVCAWGEDNFTIVDARTGVTLKTVPLPENTKEYITAAKFLPRDEKIVVGRSGRDHIMVWGDSPVTDSTQLRRYDFVSTLAISPDGKYIAGIVYFDTEIRIWNMQTGALVMSVTDSLTDFRCLAFSPDSKKIASYASKFLNFHQPKNLPSTMCLNIWDIPQSSHTGRKWFGKILNRHSRILKLKPKMIQVELQPSVCQDVLKFSSDGQYLLSSQGPIMVDDTVSEGEHSNADPPSLYLGQYRDEPYTNLWIFCGKRPVIMIPSHIPIDRHTGTYSLDVKDEKMVFGYRDRGLLILDIDTKVLSETLNSHVYPQLSMPGLPSTTSPSCKGRSDAS